MGRRNRKASDPGVDLFSFMNIMAATIGVQTLLIVISALQIKPGVQSIRLLPAEGAAKGMQANYILSNGQGKLELIGPQGRQLVDRDDAALDAFLDRIGQKNREQYLVIGVRPEGYVDFETVRSKAELRKITIGYEPLEPGLKVITPEFELGAN